MALVTASSRRAVVRPAGSVGRYLYRRPEWSVVLPVIVAWAGLALLAWGPGRHGMAMGSSSSGVASSSGRMAGHGVGPATTTADWAAAAAYLRGIAMWEVMVAAMMLPATIPLVRHVAFATRRTRRQRSIALLCLGYLLAWLPLGAVTAVWHVLGVAPGAAAVVAAVALISAGVWELTPMKVRALRLGLVNGQACVLACGPAMVALVVLGHPIVATLLVGVVMLAQATHRRGDQWRGYVAALGFLAACAVLAG